MPSVKRTSQFSGSVAMRSRISFTCRGESARERESGGERARKKRRERGGGREEKGGWVKRYEKNECVCERDRKRA